MKAKGKEGGTESSKLTISNEMRQNENAGNPHSKSMPDQLSIDAPAEESKNAKPVSATIFYNRSPIERLSDVNNDRKPINDGHDFTNVSPAEAGEADEEAKDISVGKQQQKRKRRRNNKKKSKNNTTELNIFKNGGGADSRND